MKTTHEPLNLDRWSFVRWKIMDISTSFIWIFFAYLLNMAVVRNLEVTYVGVSAEPLFIEFCNFVQYYAFVNSLVIKFGTTVYSWYDNGVIVKTQFHFMIFCSRKRSEY
jgi:hypothetical protein